VSPGVADVLRALATAFATHGLRWYVFGAQAVLAHGLPRLTSDLDITVEPGSLDNPTLLEVLRGAGVAPRDESFANRLVTSRLLPLVHAASGIPVDVVLATEGIEIDFVDRRVQRELGGVIVPVLCVEDLLATKAVAGRRKDQEDILGVLRVQAETLRMHDLRAVLSAFDEALEEPRASATFERLYRRFQKSRARPL
jgi:hypothetical protein